MGDWMLGGVNENDGDEARTEARWGPLPEDDRPSPSDLADWPDVDEEDDPDRNS